MKILDKILRDVTELENLRDSLSELSFDTFFYKEFEDLGEEVYQFIDRQVEIAVHLFLKSIEQTPNYDAVIQKYMLRCVEDLSIDFIKMKFLVRVIWTKDLIHPSKTLAVVLEKLIEHYKNSKTEDRENVIIIFEMVIDIIYDDAKEDVVPLLKEICQVIPKPTGGWEGYYCHIKKGISLLARINSPDAKNIISDLVNSEIEEVAREAKLCIRHF